MKRNLTLSLAEWIAQGARRIGQIHVQTLPAGGYELRHHADFSLSETHLAAHSDAQAARHLSLYDEAEEYRPLKSAPTLRRGWRLTVRDAAQLRLALDHFYPALTALWLSHLEGKLPPVALRETLNRQTGMYAASKRLQDAEGQELVAAACADSKCLKRVLWPFAPDQPLEHLDASKTSPPPAPDGAFEEIPLLCQEACNILVAACREVVKKRERATAPSGDPANAGNHGTHAHPPAPAPVHPVNSP